MISWQVTRHLFAQTNLALVKLLLRNLILRAVVDTVWQPDSVHCRNEQECHKSHKSHSWPVPGCFITTIIIKNCKSGKTL